MGERYAVHVPVPASTLPFAQLWYEEEEEDMIDLPIMGAMEPTVAEDPMVKMERIFRDLQQVGQQVNMASPKAAKGEKSEPENDVGGGSHCG